MPEERNATNGQGLCHTPQGDSGGQKYPFRCSRNPKIVQERLGHSSVSTTLDIYSHVLPGLQEVAARQFDESLEIRQKYVGKMSAKLN